MTIDLVLSRELAEKVFGLYLHGVEGRGDLSGFTTGMFLDEIAGRLRGLEPGEQRAVSTSLEGALALTGG